MTSTITQITDRLHEVTLDFTDETTNGETFTVTRKIGGSHQDAEAYAPVFERDVRQNYAHLLPAPAVPTYEEEEMV